MYFSSKRTCSSTISIDILEVVVVVVAGFVVVIGGVVIGPPEPTDFYMLLVYSAV